MLLLTVSVAVGWALLLSLVLTFWSRLNHRAGKTLD